MSDDEMDREIGAAIAANRNSGKHNYRAIYRAAHFAGLSQEQIDNAQPWHAARGQEGGR